LFLADWQLFCHAVVYMGEFGALAAGLSSHVAAMLIKV
jgi:hypothetical protein